MSLPEIARARRRIVRGRLSAGARVALAVTFSVAVAVALLAIIGYLVLERQLAADLDRSLLREAEAFAATLSAAADSGTADLMDVSRTYLGARTGGGGPGAVLLVRFPDGTVLSNANLHLEDAPENRPNLDPATTSRSYSNVFVGGQEYRVATVPLAGRSGNVVAVFQAAVSKAETSALAGYGAQSLVVTGLVVTLLAALLSRLVARTSLRPLHQAAATARAVTKSSLSERVPYEGPRDDVGVMVAALNDMLDRLEAAFTEQRRFLADASHELRTPLTVIRGHLDVMRETTRLRPDQEETLDLVASELTRMTQLVNDLLALARLEAGSGLTFSRIDLAEILDEAFVRAQGLGRRRMSLEADGPIYVLGDHDLLLQALLTLLDNAVQHTEEGGSVHLASSYQGAVASLSITDDGPGIPPADLPRVFDRFYRSTASRSGQAGSGLGLAIASRLVALHGGALSAGNSADGGAVFTLTLPLLSQPPAAEGGPPRRRRRRLGRINRPTS